LLDAFNVGLEKELLVYGSTAYYTRRYQEKEMKIPVNVYFNIDNSKKNQLGDPLPMGIVRLYKEDASESLQFIGEDKIDHTPKDETITLKVGKAFDVVCERRQTDYLQRTTKLREAEWEIIIRNHKEEKITVGIIEPMYGNWRILKKSHPYEKEDAFNIRFNVEIPADGEVKVRYRVSVGLT